MQRAFLLWMGWLAATSAVAADDFSDALLRLRAVGPQGAGHVAAQEAWPTVAGSGVEKLPAILAGMDGANELATNWIATAAQAVVERAERARQPLPKAALETFLLDREHSPRGRRLALELLVAADPTAEDRLVPGFLDDPAGELRREAVARLMGEAAALAKADRKRDATETYLRALAAARDFGQIRELATRLKALEHPVDLQRQLGYVVRWKLIGPFDNTGRAGFAAVYPPETALDFAAAYPGKSGEVRWNDYTSDDELGKIDFFQPFGAQREVVGYAAAEFFSSRRREVELRLSSWNATKLWLNGQPVNEYPIYHSGSQPDQYVDRVVLQPGRNVILVKVCQNEQTQDWAQRWDFQLRVCDASGAAVLSDSQP